MIEAIGGAGCAGLTFLVTGFNIAGVRRAAVSFTAGGESIQEINWIASSSLPSLEKIVDVIGAVLFGTMTGIVADSCIEVICPELSIPRALIVTVLGLGADFVSESPLLPRKPASLLGAMGRCAYIAGAILTTASSANFLVSSLNQT